MSYGARTLTRAVRRELSSGARTSILAACAIELHVGVEVAGRRSVPRQVRHAQASPMPCGSFSEPAPVNIAVDARGKRSIGRWSDVPAREVQASRRIVRMKVIGA